jgi:hypothetical protein
LGKYNPLMSKIVHISWINPAHSLDLYPEIFQGMNVEHRVKRPEDEYVFVASMQEKILKGDGQ